MSWPDSTQQVRPSRAPSVLFPMRPERPSYREPHPVRGAAVAAGLGGGLLWMLLLSLLATSIPAYGWLTLSVGVLGWALVVVLARYGDRGVATGAAIAIGCGWAVGAAVLLSIWAATMQ